MLSKPIPPPLWAACGWQLGIAFLDLSDGLGVEPYFPELSSALHSFLLAAVFNVKFQGIVCVFKCLRASNRLGQHSSANRFRPKPCGIHTH